MTEEPKNTEIVEISTSPTLEVPKKHKRQTKFSLTEEKWRPIHTKILYAVQRGLPDARVATLVKMSERTVQYIRSTELFITKMRALDARLQNKFLDDGAYKDVDKVKEMMSKLAVKAAKKYKKSLEDPKAINAVQFNVCKDILDRAGYKPKEVIETHDRTVPPEEVEAALLTIQEVEETARRLSTMRSPYILPKVDSEQQPAVTSQETGGPGQETGPA